MIVPEALQVCVIVGDCKSRLWNHLGGLLSRPGRYRDVIGLDAVARIYSAFLQELNSRFCDYRMGFRPYGSMRLILSALTCTMREDAGLAPAETNPLR